MTFPCPNDRIRWIRAGTRRLPGPEREVVLEGWYEECGCKHHYDEVARLARAARDKLDKKSTT